MLHAHPQFTNIVYTAGRGATVKEAEHAVTMKELVLHDMIQNGLGANFTRKTVWNAAIRGAHVRGEKTRTFFVCREVLFVADYFNILFGAIDREVVKNMWMSGENVMLPLNSMVTRFEETQFPVITFNTVSTLTLQNFIKWVYSVYITPKNTVELLNVWKFTIDIQFQPLRNVLSAEVLKRSKDAVARKDINSVIHIYDQMRPYDADGAAALLTNYARTKKRLVSEIQVKLPIRLGALDGITRTLATIKNDSVGNVTWTIRYTVRNGIVVFWILTDVVPEFQFKVTVRFISNSKEFHAYGEKNDINVIKQYNVRPYMDSMDTLRSQVIYTLPVAMLDKDHGYVVVDDRGMFTELCVRIITVMGGPGNNRQLGF